MALQVTREVALSRKLTLCGQGVGDTQTNAAGGAGDEDSLTIKYDGFPYDLRYF